MPDTSKILEVDDIFTILSYISTLAKAEVTPRYLEFRLIFGTVLEPALPQNINTKVGQTNA
jgi:hypothetical protein